MNTNDTEPEIRRIMRAKGLHSHSITLSSSSAVLLVLAAMQAGCLQSQAASRSTCSISFAVPTITISVPDSIDCGGSANFVGTIQTNWTFAGCRACRYRLAELYDTYFDG